MKALSYQDSIKKLNEVFEEQGRLVFPRFGDADLIMMTKESGEVGRANKNHCNPTTKKMMRDSLDIDGDSVVVGIPCNIQGAKHIGSNVPSSIKNIKLEKKNELIAWTALEHAFFKYNDEFISFFSKLKDKSYIFVGTYYNQYLDNFYGNNVGWVETPKYDSINHTEKIIQDLRTLLDTEKVDSVILSCGQAARVICYELHNIYSNINFIDVGSQSDMFIINQPEFKDIPKRSHIQHQLQKIKDKVKFYESRINNNNS